MIHLRLALCLFSLALAGCVNLGAVTDYATSAGQVLEDKKPAMRWRDSENKLLALRHKDDSCPIGRTGRRPQSEYDAAFSEAENVHNVLGKYFNTLGELASDKVPMPSQTLDSSLAAVKKAGVKVDAADEGALKAVTALLSRALDAYRHKHVREMMDATHDDIDKILDVLQRLASVYRDEVRGEGIQAENFIKCSIAQNDISDKFWGRRELTRVTAVYAGEVKAMEEYMTALAKIKKDHDKIRKALALDRDALVRTIKSIADTRKELDAARAALDKLTGA